jgi:hypothetical protein
MTLPTVQQVTNMFLYGTMTTPADLTNPALLRPVGIKGPSITVNLLEYMTDGPGRFASPALFDLVKEFFHQPLLAWYPAFIARKILLHCWVIHPMDWNRISIITMIARTIMPSVFMFGIQ